jgi:hypothetical protein
MEEEPISIQACHWIGSCEVDFNNTQK